jgi:hypothetical protein
MESRLEFWAEHRRRYRHDPLYRSNWLKQRYPRPIAPRAIDAEPPRLELARRMMTTYGCAHQVRLRTPGNQWRCQGCSETFNDDRRNGEPQEAR